MSEPAGTVLIIDSSLSARDLLRGVAQDVLPGWTIVTASSGDDALSQVSDCRHLDAALIDVNVSGRPADSVAHDLKARHPGVQVGVITSADHPAILDRASQNGFTYLTRPMDEIKVRQFLRPIQSRGSSSR